ncbi:dihydrodipicolinate synthase family protein [Bosea sp. PAMC 26642]|uniref:dihydrodipicolinate synthase family protein n=1 Tax=Bosea sp. (strain PAMC 26642) TaxID=1792307 RepID=UPI00143BFBF9|nr:dihydrodipicolinate synthase family protein [Bosea sp. PAMC 26642]
MTTPFDAAGEIDRPAFVRQVEWMLDEGVDGLVVGGSTGEGFALDEREVLDLSALALDITAGRVPVMTSIMADSSRAATQRARLLSELPLAGLQVAPPHYIFAPDDDGMVSFYADVAAATHLPIVVYNVIAWAQIRPDLAARIMTSVPSVRAVKQSDKDLGGFADLVRLVGAERVFGAIDGSLMSCYDLQVAGSIAAIASAAPGANVKLWRSVKEGDRSRALAINAALCELWSHLSAKNLPARVKVAQSVQGIPSGHPRAPMAGVLRSEKEAIRTAVRTLEAL